MRCVSLACGNPAAGASSDVDTTPQVALKAYWVDQFTKNPPKELEKEMNKAKRGQKRGRKEESSPASAA